MTALLSERERSKFDTSPDDQFYDQPKLVTHADNGFLRRLQALYDEVLSSNDRVFDMMSSWVSHLPSREFQTVIGHGLNETELERNERLDEYFTQNLNRTQQLPLSDQTVDAVCCALSVQYLQYPSDVFAEIARILDAGGVQRETRSRQSLLVQHDYCSVRRSRIRWRIPPRREWWG